LGNEKAFLRKKGKDEILVNVEGDNSFFRKALF